MKEKDDNKKVLKSDEKLNGKKSDKNAEENILQPDESKYDYDYLKVVPINLHPFFKLVGKEIYEQIVSEYGGGPLYIPSQKRHETGKLHRRIYEDYRYRGMTYRELRKRYKLSETTIRKIIKKCFDEDYKR